MIWRCDLVPQYHNYKKEIDDAMQRVLNSGRYILASEVAKFEEEFAAYLGVPHAVGVANGTDGLTLAMLALGIGPGDEVITTPYTAIPTVAAIIDTGAKPVFVDVCPETFLMDIDRVPAAMTPRTKAIMPVHIFGNVVDIPRLRSLTGGTVPIIEDACQSHGSTLEGVQTGSMGDLGVFSFYPTKNLGAYGDGGMVTTANRELADRLRLLRMYGMTDYNHIVINGINSRLDELQAAVLRVKLKYLDGMNEKRNSIARRYCAELSPGLFEHQHIPQGVYSNYHVFVSRCRGDRNRLMQFLEKKDIQTNIYYLMPIYLQEANENLGVRKGAMPVVEKLCNEVIALPMYPELEGGVLDVIIGTINEFGDRNA